MISTNWRTLLAFAHDLAACALAWMIAFLLRFNFEIPPFYLDTALHTLPWVVSANGALFVILGLYRGIWRFASLPDLRRIVLAAGAAAVAVPTLMTMLQIGVPRSVFVISPVFLVMMMGGSRFAYRAWKERSLTALADADREPVFVLGSNEAAVNLIKELARSPQWRVRGVLDDDVTRHGRELQGVKVLGGLDQLAAYSASLSVLHAIIAMPEATHAKRRRALETAREAGLQILTVPSYDDLLSGRVTISQIRNVELDDLLGRDPVQLDTSGLRSWIENQVVLITGAGGSIGSELARQIARYQPRRLILFELSEFALYAMEQEFAARHPELPVTCAIGDVKDKSRIGQVLAAHRPNALFHAAAYKHVPLMERDNPGQAVLNNVLGTHVLAAAAIESGVEKFIFISTDKAVNPTNVMGASKRLAELVCQAHQRAASTRFVTVRFGNVLGSTGSVIPKFREQIARGGPVTVTHPEITRFFMSIPEAVQLVMQAGLMGKGGEIFVLDMGEPVKIADLAREMVRLSGFTENDIKIVFTGLRPGEKLYEEVLAADENSLQTPHPMLRIARARAENGALLESLLPWLGEVGGFDDSAVKAGLGRWVPEYEAR